MDEARFWSLIEAAKTHSNGDVSKQTDRLVEQLIDLPPGEIIEVEAIVGELLARAYTKDLWAAGYILNGGCSDDGFEYFRSWLILQGKSVFYSALEDPETLADLELPDEVLECHTLFSVAREAYEEKTGEQLTRTIKFPWEMSSEELTGDEWFEDDLDEKCPRLAAKSRFWE